MTAAESARQSKWIDAMTSNDGGFFFFPFFVFLLRNDVFFQKKTRKITKNRNEIDP